MFRTFLRYVALPALGPAAIGILYLTPVELVGCLNRGLMALAVVFLSLTAGIGLGVSALRRRMAGDPESRWVAVSILILTIPALLVIGPLG